MAAKGTVFDHDFLLLIFNATAIANIADNAASSPLTNLYFSLHSSTPAGGDQTTNEIAYTSYARVAVARTSGGFTVTGASVSPVADVSFPACTGSTATATFFAVGTASTSTGKLLYFGSLSPTISISTGTTAIVGLGTVITEA